MDRSRYAEPYWQDIISAEVAKMPVDHPRDGGQLRNRIGDMQGDKIVLAMLIKKLYSNTMPRYTCVGAVLRK